MPKAKKKSTRAAQWMFAHRARSSVPMQKYVNSQNMATRKRLLGQATGAYTTAQIPSHGGSGEEQTLVAQPSITKSNEIPPADPDPEHADESDPEKDAERQAAEERLAKLCREIGEAVLFRLTLDSVLEVLGTSTRDGPLTCNSIIRKHADDQHFPDFGLKIQDQHRLVIEQGNERDIKNKLIHRKLEDMPASLKDFASLSEDDFIKRCYNCILKAAEAKKEKKIKKST